MQHQNKDEPAAGELQRTLLSCSICLDSHFCFEITSPPHCHEPFGSLHDPLRLRLRLHPPFSLSEFSSFPSCAFFSKSSLLYLSSPHSICRYVSFFSPRFALHRLALDICLFCSLQCYLSWSIAGLFRFLRPIRFCGAYPTSKDGIASKTLRVYIDLNCILTPAIRPVHW
jgi:hypothetical protein